jgi:uncharacterized protein with HEPN domain
MLDAAREASQFIAGRERADLDRDRMLTLALVKEIEIIGEAASKVSDATRKRCAGIPWAGMTAMRNRLIHGYSTVDLDIVWQTATAELPPLVAALEKCLATDRTS